MVMNVGSMMVTAKFNSTAIISGLTNVISKFKNTTLNTKSLDAQMKRLKGTFKAIKKLSLLAAGGLLGAITAAVMKSPLLAGELEKLKVEFMLLGNIIAKYVKPILQWIVKGMRWVREKFQELPEPIQSVIVKLILFGTLILGVIIALTLLVIGAGAVTTALGILFPAGVIATVVAFGSAIWAIIAGSFILVVILGVIAGLIGIWILDFFGVFDIISDIGEGFRNWDSIIRDVIATTLGFIGLLGGVGIDIARGDLGFSTTKDWYGKWKESKERATGYFKGEYEYGKGSKMESGWEGPTLEEYGKTGTNIGKQENSIVINAGNLEGSLDDPEVIKELSELFGEQLALNQQRESI